MTDLLSLAERCESATGPDRELDCAILVALDWRWRDWEEGEPTPKGMADKHGLAWLANQALEGHASIWRYLPKLTGSLDAATTLIPDNLVWQLNSLSGRDGSVATIHHGKPLQSQAATPALALCAASLRARSETA